MIKFKEMDEYAASKEPLIPELDRCAVDGSFISHPLVHGFIHYPALLNDQYKYKSELIREDPLKHMMHVEKPFRMVYLFALIAGIDCLGQPHKWEWMRGFPRINPKIKECADAFKYAWTSSENLWQHMDAIRYIIAFMGVSEIRKGMDKEERKFYDALPDKIKVYRGCSKINRNGWSWTLSLKTAEFFALRMGEQNPIIISGIVNKKDVLMYLRGRNEQELVINPEKVRSKEVDKTLTPRKKTMTDELFSLIQGASGV